MKSPISILEKKQLERNIKKLDKHEYIEILNIMKKNNQKYSKNSKGIFFNLKYISDKAIKEMIEFIKFCNKNRVFLETDNYKDVPVKSSVNNVKSNIYDGYTLDDLDITIDIKNFMDSKTTNKTNNFTFKNYLDKISVVPKKEFKNKQADKYPDLVNINAEFTGTNNRILKKCKNYENNYTKISENNTAESASNILSAESHN